MCPQSGIMRAGCVKQLLTAARPRSAALAVSQADFGLPSLHRKIPFPAAELRRRMPVGLPGIVGVWRGKKRCFELGP
jgi:hypothetical protein